MKRNVKISIIGPGCVGSALGRLAYRHGYPIAAIAGGSHPERTAELAEAIGAKVVSPAQAALAGDLVLLTVSDDAIEPVCEQLVASGSLGKKPILAHCSGALNSDALKSARQVGCSVGSMHPLQTFPNPDLAVRLLPGSSCFIEGDEPAARVLEEFARAIGAKAVRIEPQAKTLYHAAAVFSANYLTTLLEAALDLYEAAGLERDQARKAMGPLVRATIENTLEHAADKALTGPIARGDVKTVSRHVRALREKAPDIVELYRTIARRTVDLAKACGKIDSQRAEELRDLLESEN